MAVLYRKYRPQTFAEVVGQKYIIQTLKNQVKSGAISHAYLFTGTRGVGKTSVARILAKAVNCESANKLEGDACGECGVCKAVEANNFIDLVEIDAASNTGVDNIRELIEHVKFSPSVGKYKVFIIDEVHMLSKGAFNALLKTLEEPPKHAIFVLATTETGKVPATIISRSQRFDFKNLSAGDLEEHLAKIIKAENLVLDAKVISLIAKNAEGSVRDSLSLLEKILSLGENPSLEDCMHLLGATEIALSSGLLEIIAVRQPEKVPAYVDSVLEKGNDLHIFVRDFLEYLRKVLVFKAAAGKIEPSLENQDIESFKNLALEVSMPEIMLFIRLFLKAYKDMDYSPLPTLPLLVAAVEAATRPSSTSQNFSAAKAEADKKKALIEVKAPEVLVSSITTAEAVLVLEEKSGEKNITFEEIKIAWPAVAAKAREIHLPLANLLKNASLEQFLEGKLVLAVKFLFNKQSLETTKNQQLLKNICQEVLGRPLGFSIRLAKPEIHPGQPIGNLDDALKLFGGELIP